MKSMKTQNYMPASTISLAAEKALVLLPGHTFTKYDICYKVTHLEPNEVQIVSNSLKCATDLNVSQVTYNGITYFVTSIYKFAFRRCKFLKTASFLNVTDIGFAAFSSCSNLMRINCPKATAIGLAAFEGCRSLTTGAFPAVRAIGDGAFVGCRSLTVANFQSATVVGMSAFYNCDALETVVFPNVTDIGEGAFENCISLTQACFPKLTAIAHTLFKGCRALTSATFAHVTDIGDESFQDCLQLTNLSFGFTPPKIVLSAFNGCKMPCLLTFVDEAGHLFAGTELHEVVANYKNDSGFSPITGLWYGRSFIMDIAKAMISLTERRFRVTGSQITPKVAVYFNSKPLTEGLDFEVTYGENTYPGIGMVTILGKGAYQGTRTVVFEIESQKIFIVIPSVKHAATTPAAGFIRSEADKPFCFSVLPDKGYVAKVATDTGETLYPYEKNRYIIKKLNRNVRLIIDVVGKGMAVEDIRPLPSCSKARVAFVPSFQTDRQEFVSDMTFLSAQQPLAP